jgi:hypothetical protein
VSSRRAIVQLAVAVVPEQGEDSGCFGSYRPVLMIPSRDARDTTSHGATDETLVIDVE